MGQNDDGTRFLITHELGHAIAFHNPDLYSQFLTQVFAVAHPLDTVNCTNPRAGNAIQPWECFPDMLGFFFTYKDVQFSLDGGPPNWQKISDYPQNYPVYYNFAKNNVFVPVVPAFTQSSTQTTTPAGAGQTDTVVPEGQNPSSQTQQNPPPGVQ